MFDPAVVDPVVDVLAELAGNGRALELGIGTGRIALPLAKRGIEVHGIDLSNSMVSKLRAKLGGEQIAVTIGDFATTRAEGTFGVAYLVSYVFLSPSRRFLLPPPHEVLAHSFFRGRNLHEQLSATWDTAQVSIAGLVIAFVIGATGPKISSVHAGESVVTPVRTVGR